MPREMPDSVKQIVKDWADKLKNWVCPDCDAKIEEQVQAGRCVYAKPCGHRLFQGKAQKKPRNVNDEPEEYCGCDPEYTCVKHRK